MKYSSHNAGGASVHDLDTGKTIDHVLRLDTKRGTVVTLDQPWRLTATGALRTTCLRYKAVWPIHAGQAQPVMFQCYGRKRP